MSQRRARLCTRELPPRSVCVGGTERDIARLSANSVSSTRPAGQPPQPRAARPAGRPHDPGYRARARPLFALTMALKSAPALNLGTDVFGTLTAAPVAGLRAVRAGRTCFSNTPNPEMATLSPLATVS